MGVRRQAGALAVLDLLAEAVELLLAEAALEERAGVDARRAVALDVDLVAAALVVLAAEEVVEADLVEARRGLVGGDVAADLEALAVGRGDHDRGVPADEGADAALDLLVAGEPRLALRRDRVDVVGGAQGRDADLLLARALEQAQHHVAGAVAAAVVEHRVEGREPLLGLVRVDVGQLGGEALVDHRRDGRVLAGLLRGTSRRHSPAHRVTRRRRHEIYPWVVPACGATGARSAAVRRGGAWTGVAAPAVFRWTMRITPDRALVGHPGHRRHCVSSTVGDSAPGDRNGRPARAQARHGRPGTRLGQRHR